MGTPPPPTPPLLITAILPLLLVSLPLAILTPTTHALGFKCYSSSQCWSVVGYVSQDNTTLSAIQSLFSIKHLHTLLGANGFPLWTLPNSTVSVGDTVRIPFKCACSNGSGTSVGGPIYFVRKDDGLYHIAADIFSHLVDYHDIQAVNKILNADRILVGQRLQIPLPCSCDEVDGMSVVHYGHRVAEGSTVDGIATQFGVTKELLMRLNGIPTEADLIADHILDVPLKACTSSSISNDSLDAPLLVPSSSYVLTANNCVKCSCNATYQWKLQCEPSGITQVGATGSEPSCSSLQCLGSNLYIGSSAATSCEHTSCEYGGYTNQTIHANLTTMPTCPAPNYASRIKLEASIISWNTVLVVMLILLPLPLPLPLDLTW